MRKIVITITLLFISIFSLYAASALTDEQIRQRDQKLEQFKQQFISATGFDGYVNYNYQNVTISEYIGNFPGVPLPEGKDTLAVKTAATSIFNIMKPFIHASPDQLTKTKIWVTDYLSTVTYTQLIKGVSFEFGGRLSITFDHYRNVVDIVDGTHKISDNEPILISLEQALKIVKDERTKRNFKTVPGIDKPPVELLYSSNDHLHDNYPYRKYWRIGFIEGAYYVDCNTGKISFVKEIPLYDSYNYYFRGNEYDKNATGAGFNLIGKRALAGIGVYNDSLGGWTDQNGHTGSQTKLSQSFQSENYDRVCCSENW